MSCRLEPFTLDFDVLHVSVEHVIPAALFSLLLVVEVFRRLLRSLAWIGGAEHCHVFAAWPFSSM
ncbi:MAG: hypothetical protein WC815_24145 [Vicinamibacterales bacterium]